MPGITSKLLLGLVVGTLIGVTGLGGGVLLLPCLIFGLGMPPIVAVGSDMLCNFVTKIGAGILHWRNGHVDWRIVGALCVGSVPGVFGGVALLAHLRAVYGAGVNDILKNLIGVLLVVVPLMLLFQGRLQRDADHQGPLLRMAALGLIVAGAVTGFLVGMTSVGSGSILMLLLFMFYRFSPRTMVGTDIAHAVVLTGTASFLHFRLGTVDLKLVSELVLGAIPGGLIGARLSNHVPAYWLRRLLCGMLLATGARMLSA
jgi:uncharacterized protein